MRREPFDSGWSFRRRVNPFQEMGGQAAPWTEVTLPHDAMLTEPRSPEHAVAVGYHPSGAYEYRKSFTVPEALKGQRVTLELEGVYRDALVYVNGDYVGHRPYGYSQFFLDI